MYNREFNMRNFRCTNVVLFFIIYQVLASTIPEEINTTTLPETTTSTSVSDEITPTPEEPCIGLKIANISKKEPNKTSLNVSVSLAGSANCFPVELSINCNSEDHFDWVIKKKSYTLNITENYTDITLDELSEFTNYTCQFNITSAKIQEDITFRTADAAPSEVKNLTVTNDTSSSFYVGWKLPGKVPTFEIFGYNITVTRKGVFSESHFWSGCPGEPNETINAYTNETFYYFNEGLPDFYYDVSLSAWSTAGAGEETNISLATKPAASKPPNNVIWKVEQDEKTNYKNIIFSLNTTWDLPCNTNGPVNYFVFNLSGRYIYADNIIDNCNFSLPLNSNKSYGRIHDMMAASNYILQIYAKDNASSVEGEMYEKNISIQENYASAVDVIKQTKSAHNFSIKWAKPTNNPGNVTAYKINVKYLQLNWPQTNACEIKKEYSEETIQWENEFTATGLVPCSSYDVEISAKTSSRDWGNSTILNITSTMSEPELINMVSGIKTYVNDADTYNISGIIEFTPGCFNGKFKSYKVLCKGSRTGFQDHDCTSLIGDYRNKNYSFPLRPEYNYNITVSVQNLSFKTSRSTVLISPSGVPNFDIEKLSNIEAVTSSSKASLTLRKEYFGSANGDLKFIAIIISSHNRTGGEFHDWTDDSQWPEPYCADADVYYQATEKFWNPFLNYDSVDFIIGQNSSCSEGENFCNGPLEAGKTYFVFIRMFNSHFYRNTLPITFATDPISKLETILGITLGLLSVSFIGLLAFVAWKKRFFERFVKRQDAGPETEISNVKFVEYCDHLEHNPELLNKQWNDLEETSKEIYHELTSYFAILSENRRKNRYSNILPFDHNRVKLNIDEDDEICSDYINASYIKGFSNKNEYIATQGPLPHTVRDFWKMIFQENVTVIVMVARFIENKREKCYKYFPNNHESMLIGDDMEVRCVTELHFQIYCIRTLQLRKDTKQITLTHMQFLEWPDFGVPEGTDNLLLFCHRLRKRCESEGGMAVVHCSAGVGRTGTIIATDILIQALHAGRKLDVYNTVLDLRRQRNFMVQAKSQYMYINYLLKSIIEEPIVDDQDEEHLYENIKLESTANENGNIIESRL